MWDGMSLFYGTLGYLVGRLTRTMDELIVCLSNDVELDSE